MTVRSGGGQLAQFSPQRSPEGTLQMISREVAAGLHGLRDLPRPYLTLSSPDGALWRIAIGNTGTVTTTKIKEPP